MQDWYYGDFGVGNVLYCYWVGLVGQGVWFGIQVGGGFVGQQCIQFVGQFVEIFGVECSVVYQVDFVLYQWVVYFDDFYGWEGEQGERLLFCWIGGVKFKLGLQLLYMKCVDVCYGYVILWIYCVDLFLIGMGIFSVY